MDIRRKIQVCDKLNLGAMGTFEQILSLTGSCLSAKICNSVYAFFAAISNIFATVEINILPMLINAERSFLYHFVSSALEKALVKF